MALLDAKETEVKAEPVIFNTMDDASNLSVTSVSPLPEKVDQVDPKDNTEIEGEVKEASPAADAPEEEEKVEAKAEPPKETEESRQSKTPEAVQKRIDEITRKRREAERERDAERDKRLELEKKIQEFEKTIPATDKPLSENYETEQEYLEALTDWKIEQKLSKKQEVETRQTKEQADLARARGIYVEVDKKSAEGRKKYTDYDELVLSDKLKITDSMLETVLELNAPSEVLYYLGKHPDESAEIAGMSMIKASVALSKIDHKLTTPVKRTTSTPEPISPVRSTGAVEVNPERMSMKEFRAWRAQGST